MLKRRSTTRDLQNILRCSLMNDRNELGMWTMVEYLSGWRRKVGVVTLVMACVLAVGWVRCQSTFDSIRIPMALRRWIHVDSRGGRLYLSDNSLAQGKVQFRWEVTSPNSDESRIMFRASDLSVHLLGMGIGTLDRPANPLKPTVKFAVIVNYWLLVIPLTLLSSYLLLSKPRSKGRQVTELGLG